MQKRCVGQWKECQRSGSLDHILQICSGTLGSSCNPLKRTVILLLDLHVSKDQFFKKEMQKPRSCVKWCLNIIECNDLETGHFHSHLKNRCCLWLAVEQIPCAKQSIPMQNSAKWPVGLVVGFRQMSMVSEASHMVFWMPRCFRYILLYMAYIPLLLVFRPVGLEFLLLEYQHFQCGWIPLTKKWFI
jgi:hypothetical protein